MIRISGLTKTFEGFNALDHIDMHVEKGSIYGLLGTNGAGKTTLLKLVAGIYKKSSGTIEIFEEGEESWISRQERIQFLADEPIFLDQGTLEDASRLYKVFYPSWNQERYIKLLEGLNLDERKALSKLSKGQKRLGTFCLALSAMPDIMLLDEPLDGIDPVLRHKIKNLLVQDVAERGMSVVVSSHNIRELEELCDTIGVLHNGRLLFQEDLDSMKNYIHKAQVVFSETVTPQWPQSLRILSIEIQGSSFLLIVKGQREVILEQLRGMEPVIIDLLPLTLEEIFINELGDKGYAVENIIL